MATNNKLLCQKGECGNANVEMQMWKYENVEMWKWLKLASHFNFGKDCTLQHIHIYTFSHFRIFTFPHFHISTFASLFVFK